MCLRIDKKTKKIKRDMYIYKLLTVKVGYLQSPYQQVSYRPGWNYPDHVIRLNKYIDRIHDGCIHAFTKLSSAKCVKIGTDVIIRCKVKKEDIIAFGEQNEVALRRLYINPKRYKIILNTFSKDVPFYIGN